MPWTEAGDLAGFDLVLPLVAWGYHLRYAEWLRFLDRLEREQLPGRQPARCCAGTATRPIWPSLAPRASRPSRRIEVEALDDASLRCARPRIWRPKLVIKPPVSGVGGRHASPPRRRCDSGRRSAAGG